MLNFILAFVASFGLTRRPSHQDTWRPEPDWPERRADRERVDRVIAEARSAGDGVNHPLIL